MRPSRYLDPQHSTKQGLSKFDRSVLDVVDRIPPGRVMSYGSIADHLQQGTPRLVARVMSTKSDPDTPWHRVLRSNGTCAPEVATEQLRLLRTEGVVFVSGSDGRPTDRVDLTVAMWAAE
jgi:methylated-DNA-protein-cysteine methyltransferase related protein